MKGQSADSKNNVVAIVVNDVRNYERERERERELESKREREKEKKRVRERQREKKREKKERARERERVSVRERESERDKSEDNNIDGSSVQSSGTFAKDDFVLCHQNRTSHIGPSVLIMKGQSADSKNNVVAIVVNDVRNYQREREREQE